MTFLSKLFEPSGTWSILCIQCNAIKTFSRYKIKFQLLYKKSKLISSGTKDFNLIFCGIVAQNYLLLVFPIFLKIRHSDMIAQYDIPNHVLKLIGTQSELYPRMTRDEYLEDLTHICFDMRLD